MKAVWDLPWDELLFEHNPDWFMLALKQASADQRVMFLMVQCRVWHMHNEITHNKQPAPVLASKRSLESYTYNH
jgi:hypothetical protein